MMDATALANHLREGLSQPTPVTEIIGPLSETYAYSPIELNPPRLGETRGSVACNKRSEGLDGFILFVSLITT